MKSIFIASLIALATFAAAQPKGDTLQPHRLGTAIDLADWLLTGDVTLAKTPPSLHIGTGKATAQARYTIPALHVVFAEAVFADPTAKAQVRVQCLDKSGKVVLNLTGQATTKDGRTTAGVYFKTHAFSTSVVISIVKEEGDEPIEVRSVEVRDEDGQRKTHTPRSNTSQYLEPIWMGTTAFNETVLLQTDDTGPATGRLLFEPSKILSVQDYGLGQVFKEGVDFTVSGKTIAAIPGSKISVVHTKDFEKGDLKWNIVLGKQVVVTYEHKDTWQGPIPKRSPRGLSKTMQRLKEGRSLVIAASGDSVTLGVGTSGYMGIPPYMPTWPSLVSEGLKKVYPGASIKLFNTAVGGMTSDWGAETAEQSVGDLKPDLVLIAFGLNDFWWMPAERLRDNTKAMMDRVRAKSPEAEFILIVPMRYDPVYTMDPQYAARLESYTPALKSLAEPGVQVLDMSEIAKFLQSQKAPKDLLADPLHPNDYMARWYAQGTLQLLKP